MKTLTQKISLLLAAAALTMTSTAFSAEEIPSKEVYVGISDAYIPSDLSSNDDAFVAVSGMFPNGCYRWNRAEVTTHNTYNHTIKSVANVSQGMCLMVLVPFNKEVKLGKLAAGKHTLRFVDRDDTYLEKTLEIK